MTAAEHFGSNKDLTANKDYCCYCYDDGCFTDEETTMDEMIERCAEMMESYHEQTEREFNKEEAIAQMQKYFPLLKRWKAL